MSDFRMILANLRRPKLLIRAARCGLQDYSRDRDLRRLIGAPLRADQTLPRLLDEEERLEQIRKSGGAAYSIARHIEVLIALMAEVRLLPRNADA